MDTLQIMNLKVEAVMNTFLITVKPNDTLQVVDEIFSEQKIHHLPVVDDQDQLLGMISSKEVELMKHWGTKMGLNKAKKTNEFLFSTMLAKDVMAKNMVTITKDRTLEFCADIFKENLFHSLPVVEDGKLIGIITSYDLLTVAYRRTPLIVE